MNNFAFSLLTLTLTAVTTAVFAVDWSYDRHSDNGPAHWAALYPTCGGVRQSPIDIRKGKAVFNSTLSTLDLSSYDESYDSLVSHSITNNGHSAQVSFIYSSPESVYYISGGGLPGRYVLEQFHFHWGTKDNVGSEHTVNGKSYPMEVHFVHYREDLRNVATAKNYPNGLAVIGLFFKIESSNNEAYDDIANALVSIRYRGQTVPLPQLTPSSLLPDNTDKFYSYSGSLTTPGCNEAVTWIVLDQPVTISKTQLRNFRRMYESAVGVKVQPIENNYRPTQPINDRTVYFTV